MHILEIGLCFEQSPAVLDAFLNAFVIVTPTTSKATAKHLALANSISNFTCNPK